MILKIYNIKKVIKIKNNVLNYKVVNLIVYKIITKLEEIFGIK